MEYLLMIASDENANPRPGTPDFDRWMAEWGAYSASLVEGGHFVAGAGLLPTSSATTLRKSSGAASEVTDGPFAETKEQLGGFYLVNASDLDEALKLAEALPIPNGSIEIRPLSTRVEG
jgi:hypothetical protein